MVPLGQRFTTPQEVAAPVLFLASDLASHITSTTINVTGGQLVY
jgi:NAD(P)-dependent dehydrogenase (short-subunit alcohol dehydrogenase family)